MITILASLASLIFGACTGLFVGYVVGAESVRMERKDK